MSPSYAYKHWTEDASAGVLLRRRPLALRKNLGEHKISRVYSFTKSFLEAAQSRHAIAHCARMIRVDPLLTMVGV